MLIDKNGNPVSSKKRHWLNKLSRIKNILKNKTAWIITAIGTLALVLANLTNILDFYERVTDGPEFVIPVEVRNDRNDSIQIYKLLALYITSTQFHSGRLIAGELPTSRVSLTSKDKVTLYNILPGDKKKYKVTIQERPYKSRLNSGGNTIVFVLRLKDSNELYYLEEPFHRDVLNFIALEYNVK